MSTPKVDNEADLEAEADRLVDAALNGDKEALMEFLSVTDEGDDNSAERNESSDPSTQVLLRSEEGETTEQLTARTFLRPDMQAAAASLCLSQYGKMFSGQTDLNSLISSLDEQVKAVTDRDLDRGEAMLACQAHTLDALFNALLRKALDADTRALLDSYFKFALRAQSQCRATWEAISAIQNPPLAGYVKQANIAHGHQQVNNNTRTGGNENPRSKVLEHTQYEPDQWMDQGTPTATEEANSPLETVGAIHRTANGRG